jgi:hypothetical protein
LCFIGEIAAGLTSNCAAFATAAGSGSSSPTADVTVTTSAATASSATAGASTSRSSTDNSTALATMSNFSAKLGPGLKLHVVVALVSVLAMLNLLGS